MRLRVKTVAGAEVSVEVDPSLPLSVARAQIASALELDADPPLAVGGRLLSPADDERSLGELGLRDGGVVVAIVRKAADAVESPAPPATGGAAPVAAPSTPPLPLPPQAAPLTPPLPAPPQVGAEPAEVAPGGGAPASPAQRDDELARQLQADEDERAARRVQEDLDADMAREEQVRQAQGDARAAEVASTPRLLHVRCELPACGDGTQAPPWIPLMLDTGAQFSVLTSSLAERLGLLGRLDRSAAGIAGGVGHARILGKLRGVTVRLGELDLAVDFAVLDGSQLAGGNLAILGLDQLAVHHMVVDLDARVLRIGGCEGYAVRILENYEVPEEFRPEASMAQRCAIQ